MHFMTSADGLGTSIKNKQAKTHFVTRADDRGLGTSKNNYALTFEKWMYDTKNEHNFDTINL